MAEADPGLVVGEDVVWRVVLDPHLARRGVDLRGDLVVDEAVCLDDRAVDILQADPAATRPLVVGHRLPMTIGSRLYMM